MTFEDFWFIYGLTKSVRSLHIDSILLVLENPLVFFRVCLHLTRIRQWSKNSFYLAIGRPLLLIARHLLFGQLSTLVRFLWLRLFLLTHFLGKFANDCFVCFSYSQTFAPAAPFITEDRLRMLKMILASPNSNLIHINRESIGIVCLQLVDVAHSMLPTTLAILCQC